jgi:hypothetical protein
MAKKSFIKSKGFKYAKNLIIGVGAAIVLVGALFKIMSWPGAGTALTIGLLVEAGLFLMMGILPPEKDYYWENLYPGLDTYGEDLAGSRAGGGGGADIAKALENVKLDTTPMENKLDGMLTELQVMSKSMSSLKALQEVDFGNTADQITTMSKFYANLNEAMSNINESIEDTRVYKEQLSALNKNLGQLNGVYGNILGAMSSIGGK